MAHPQILKADVTKALSPPPHEGLAAKLAVADSEAGAGMVRQQSWNVWNSLRSDILGSDGCSAASTPLLFSSN